MKKVLVVLMVILMSSLVMAIPTPTAEPLFRGDLNKDEVVNCRDLDIYKDILNSGEYNKRADVNSDGGINFLDTFWYLKEVGFCPEPTDNTDETPVSSGSGHRCSGEIEFKRHYECNHWKATRHIELLLDGSVREFLIIKTDVMTFGLREGQTRNDGSIGFKFVDLDEKITLMVF